MNTRLQHRVVSLVLALAVTAGVFGGIDGLAGLPEASAQWAAALVAPRG
jgi:hypothetical protein